MSCEPPESPVTSIETLPEESAVVDATAVPPCRSVIEPAGVPNDPATLTVNVVLLPLKIVVGAAVTVIVGATEFTVRVTTGELGLVAAA
jgi:hypothetical protein